MRVIQRIPLVLFLVAQSWLPAGAQQVVDPGDGIQVTVADDCATAEDAHFPIQTAVRCNAAAGTAGAAWGVGSLGDFGNPRTAAAVFNTFSVSATPETADRFVAATIAYEVAWKGLLQGASIGLSKAGVEVEYELTDMTNGTTVNKGVIWGKTTDGFSFGIDFIPVEIARDVNEGTANHAIPAILMRGHQYRFVIRVTCSGRLFAETGGFTCDYEDEDQGYGIVWRSLQIKLGPDDQEIADRLESLEGEIEKLKNHTHEYRTGVGAGHNNTPATSSPPKF